jgi:putative sterol carrier protein
MPSDLFAAADILAWQHQLNHSAEFQEAAASWRGRLLLVDTAAEHTRSTWIVVDHGRCTEARNGTAADAADADFVLAASATTWASLMNATITPSQAALAGKLSLRKGSVMGLLPHARAAAALLAAFAGS